MNGLGDESTGVLGPASHPFTDNGTPGASGGFVIESLELSGFMRYVSKTSLVFPRGLTVITGRTGAGKTTLLDAITFALYKQTTRTDASVKIEELFSSMGGHVHLRFRQDGKEFEVTRGIDGKKKPYVQLKMNGSRVAGSIPETDQRIQDIIGLDYVAFRNSTFVRQEEMRQLGAETGSERMRIVQRLFRLEVYEKARAIASQRAKEKETEIREMRAGIEGKRALISDLPALQKELERINADVEPLDKTLEESAKTILQAETELKRLKTVHEEYIALREETRRLCSTLEELDKKRRKATDAYEKTKDLRARLVVLEERLGKIKNNGTEQKKLLARLEEQRKLKSKIDLKKERVEAIADQKNQLDAMLEEQEETRQKRIKDLHKKISALSTDIAADEAFALLRSEGALQERLQRIPRELEWVSGKKVLEGKLKEELGETEDELKKTARKTGTINADTFSVKAIRDELSDIQRESEGARKRHETKRARLLTEQEKVSAELQDLLGEKSPDSEIRKIESELESIERAEEEHKRLKTETDSLRAELYKSGDASERIYETDEAISKNKAELKEKTTRLTKMEQSEKSYVLKEDELQRLRQRERDIREELVKLRTTLQERKRNIEKAMAISQDLKKAEEKIEAVSEEQAILDILAKGVFHPTGVVTYAVGQLLPHLETTSSRHLCALTEGRLSKVRLQHYSDKRDFGIAIEIEGPGVEWRDVSSFSGGEKTQINAALRFAIAEELSSIVQFGSMRGRMRTLMIDEGDLGSLDSDVSRRLFVSKLVSMAGVFEKVILITHIEGIAETFPNRILVHMTAGNESRAEMSRGV